MSLATLLGNARRALAVEGPRAAVLRLLDRAADERRRQGFLEVSAATATARLAAAERTVEAARPRVLHVLGVPLRRASGGVEQQLLARLAVTDDDTTACLVPAGPGWRLELAGPLRREVVRFPGAGEAGFEAALRDALAVLRPQVLHVENVPGLPLAGLSTIATSLPTVLSVHDFSLFCPRPHALAAPAEGGCSWSGAGCARCAAEPAAAAEYGARRGDDARRLLAAARAVVFPSPFLAREVTRRLGVELGPRARVIAPAIPLATLRARPRSAGSTPLRRHVAFVGSVQPHKGARVLLAAAPELRAAGHRVSAYGGGDPELLAALARAGVRVRGYHRAGTLPRRLRADGVELALLLSTWPESYGLALDECAHAGVPVVAFAQGALGERLQGSGLLVPPEAGAPGVVAAVARWSSGRYAEPAAPLRPSTPTAARRAYDDLYAELAAD